MILRCNEKCKCISCAKRCIFKFSVQRVRHWQIFVLDKTTLLKLESNVLNSMLHQVLHFLHYSKGKNCVGPLNHSGHHF